MINSEITDINGKTIKVPDIDKAIKECSSCKNNPLVIKGTRYTIGENNRFMLPQLWKLKKEISYATK
ncbi:MAG: NADH-quinone oxidoreductase subunit F [Prevotella sp.]|jgi:hypothetical protein|nr:NADH-quinone oxidoreductase subunit F [Prevotella sp.]